MAKNKIETTLQAVNSGLDYGILTGTSDLYEYDKSGKKTTETPLGKKIDFSLPGNRLTQLTVKILGADPLPQVTDDQINAACASMKFIFVKFADCKVSIYTMNGQIGMTATAQGVQIVSNSK